MPWKSLEKALQVTGSNTEHVFARATCTMLKCSGAQAWRVGFSTYGDNATQCMCEQSPFAQQAFA